MKRRWNSGVCIAGLRKAITAMKVALQVCTSTPFEMIERSFSALKLANVSVAQVD